MSDPHPRPGWRGEQSGTRLSAIQHLREAAASRVEQTSLRGVAREIGMSPTGLKRFLSGTDPYTPTVRRLRSWYLQHAAIATGRVTEADARAAITVLSADLPPEIGAAFAVELMGIVERGYAASRERVPPWVAQLRDEYGRAARPGALALIQRLTEPSRAADAGAGGDDPRRWAVIADYHRARSGFEDDAGLASAMGVPEERVLAWKTGTQPPTSADGQLLSHLGTVVAELDRFLDPDVIPDWLLAEHHALGGRTAIQALRDGMLAEVLFAVNATEHGAYT